MSFIQVIRILWARKNIILAGVLTCLAASLIAAVALPKRYEASSRVMLDIVKPDPVTGQVLSSPFLRVYTQTQTKLVTDYRVTGRAVDKLGLASSPELAEEYADRPKSNTQDFRRWLAQIVAENTQAQVVLDSNILEITYTGSTPEEARRGADALLEAYIDQTIALKREDATSDKDWFDDQLDKLRTQLTDAQQRKTAFERENNIVLTEENVDADERRLQALAASPEPLYTAMPAAYQATRDNSDLARVDAEIATASKTLGPNHPTLIALRQQRAGIAKAMADNRSDSIASMSSIPTVLSQINQQTQKVLAQRGKVNEAQQLAAEVASLRQAYQVALDKTASLEQQTEAIESGLTPLGKAVAPESPAFPKYPLLILGGAALGGLLGFLSAIIAELLNRRIRGVEDLEPLGIPVVGSMGEDLDRKAPRLSLPLLRPRKARSRKWELAA